MTSISCQTLILSINFEAALTLPLGWALTEQAMHQRRPSVGWHSSCPFPSPAFIFGQKTLPFPLPQRQILRDTLFYAACHPSEQEQRLRETRNPAPRTKWHAVRWTGLPWNLDSALSPRSGRGVGFVQFLSQVLSRLSQFQLHFPFTFILRRTN